MAETNVDTAAETTADSRGLRTQVVVGTTTVYQFFIDSGNDLMYRKSTDSGLNWGSKVTVKLATVIATFDVWYDKWTPGDTGTKIYIAYTNVTGVDDTCFNSLDTSSDTLSGEITVHNGVNYTATGGSWVQSISITKAQGGNLYIACNPDGGSEEHFYRSTDGGANWTSRATLYEGAPDRAILFPADTSDTQDVAAAYWDVSANAWSMKMYDDSANTWTETAGASATESSSYFQMAGAIRHSDQHLILLVWNDINAAGADLLCYDITLDAIDLTGKITAKTNVITNAANCFGCTVSINQYNDDIYVAMLGKSDGSETFESLVHVYYCRSTDGGSTWTQQIPVSTTIDDHRAVWSDPGSGTTGLFLPVWFNDDLNDLLCDAALSVIWGRITGLTASNSNTDATSYATETVLIGPSDRGYILTVENRKTGSTPDTPTVSGWTQIDTVVGAAGDNRATAFKRYGNDTPASFTIDFAGATQLNCQWAVHELNDVNTSEFVVQKKTGSATSATPSLAFDAAFGSASNMTFAAIVGPAITTDDWYTPDSNMLELKEISATGLEAGHMQTQWKNGEEATVNWTSGSSVGHGYIIIEIADVAFGASALKKIFNETVQISEGIIRKMSMKRLFNETEQIVESVIRRMSMKRLFDDTVQIVEAIPHLLSMKRTFNETVQISEVVQRLQTLRRAFNDTIQITEVAQRLQSLRRSFNDTVQIVEGIVRKQSLVRWFNETVQIVENLTRLQTMRRTLNDTVQITETRARVMFTNVTKVFNDTIQIIEIVSRNLALVRHFNDTVQIEESIRRCLSLVRRFNETIEISEAVRICRALVRRFNETVNIGESLSKTIQTIIVRAFNETVQITETLLRNISMVRRLNETVEIGEGILRRMTLRRIISETVNIGESLIRIRPPIKVIISETVQIVEATIIDLMPTLRRVVVRIYRPANSVVIRARSYQARIKRNASLATIKARGYVARMFRNESS